MLIAAGSLLLYVGCAGKKPENIGLRDNKLSPCPSSPNCVSSQEGEDERHRLLPLTYSITLNDAHQQLVDVIQSMQRTHIVTVGERYLHVEFRSAMFRFVDDVEFYFDDERKLIHVRSASRVGYSDFGMNRKRIESIRSRYHMAK